MLTRYVTRAVIAATLVLSAGNVFAERKITTVQGVLGASSDGKSMLKTEGDNGYYFNPSSEAGKKILSVCESGKTCIVRGVIKGSHILTAYYVKKPE